MKCYPGYADKLAAWLACFCLFRANENHRRRLMEDTHSHAHAAPDLSGHSEAWDHLLAHAAPQDHIVHLYQDQDFLNRVVCRFAAAALANGEAVILVPTLAHWEDFRPRLEAEGVDIKGAQNSGQLNIVDADELLPRFMQRAMPDGPMFLGLPARSSRRPARPDASATYVGGARW